jgi:hypothetical protein
MTNIIHHYICSNLIESKLKLGREAIEQMD